MALNINLGGTFKQPIKAYTKIGGEWTPVKKVFLNQTELEIRSYEKTEYQLSLTNRTLNNQIAQLEKKATSIPLNSEELAQLNFMKETQKVSEVEAVELSKQINIARTEQIFTQTLTRGVDIIQYLKDKALISEVSFRVLEVSQILPTLENIDLVFIKPNDFYFYGRYYRVIDLREGTSEAAYSELTTRLGGNNFNYINRNIKETLLILSNYITDATNIASKKIDTIQKQHSFVETKLEEVKTIATTTNVTEQNLINPSSVKTNTIEGEVITVSIDPTKKVGDILLKMYEVPSLTDLSVNATKTIQYDADIAKQKDIINTVSENADKLAVVSSGSDGNSTDVVTIAETAAKLFEKIVSSVNPVTQEVTTTTTNVLTELYDLNLSANITTAPAGTIQTAKVYGNPKPIIESIINNTILEDSSFVFSYNTYDTEGGIVISFEAFAQNGTVILNEVNKTVTYYCAQDYVGTDIITLKATDNELDPAYYQIPVTVTQVNDAPRYIDIVFNANGTEETVFTAPFSVSDLEDSNIPITSITATSTLGVCEIIQDSETGIISVVLTPYENAFGSGTITIKATDSEGLFTNKILSINLAGTQDDPTMAIISDKTINEDVWIDLGLGLDLFDMAYGSDGSVSLSRVFGFSDPDNTSVAFSYTSSAGSSIIVTDYNIDGRRKVYYIPKLNFFGTDTLTITGTDPDGNTVIGSFNVYVNSVNDPAVIDMVTTKSINEDTLETTIAYTFSDPDNDYNDYNITIKSITAGTGDALIDKVNNLVIYKPMSNYFGTTNIVISFYDTINNIEYLRNLDIIVNNINDAPEVTILSETTMDEDTIKEISFEIFDIDSISFVYEATALNGSVSINNSTKVLTYIPNENFFGVDNITFTVTDSNIVITKNVVININSVNDIPELNFEYIKVNNNGSAEIKYNTTDLDGDEVVINNIVATNGNCTIDTNLKIIYYTPNSNFNGLETVSFTITDNIIETPINKFLQFNVVNNIELVYTNYVIGTITPELIDYFLATDLNTATNTDVLIESVLWKI